MHEHFYAIQLLIEADVIEVPLPTAATMTAIGGGGMPSSPIA